MEKIIMDEKQQKIQLIKDSKEKLHYLIKSLDDAVESEVNKKGELLKTLGDFSFDAIKSCVDNGQTDLVKELFKNSADDVLSVFNDINEINQEIDSYDKKKDEIKKRYDEEIEILSLGLDLDEESHDVQEIVEVCPKCKRELKPGATFCGYCGKKIK